MLQSYIFQTFYPLIILSLSQLSDLLFEWLYKNESLKALGESGYFDNPLNEESFNALEDDIYDKRNGRNPEYFELEANFCDDLNEVTSSI